MFFLANSNALRSDLLKQTVEVFDRAAAELADEPKLGYATALKEALYHLSGATVAAAFEKVREHQHEALEAITGFSHFNDMVINYDWIQIAKGLGKKKLLGPATSAYIGRMKDAKSYLVDMKVAQIVQGGEDAPVQSRRIAAVGREFSQFNREAELLRNREMQENMLVLLRDEVHLHAIQRLIPEEFWRAHNWAFNKFRDHCKQFREKHLAK